nr:hypothetical protein [Dermacoccus sp. 147Ba]
MVRHDGHRLSPSTVLRIMADEGLLLHADYQKQRRELAKQRKAAFAAPPTGRVRTRSGSSTSVSTRPLAAGPGGLPVLRTITRSTSSAGTGHRPRTSTTRSPVSNSPSRRPKRCSAACPWSTI